MNALVIRITVSELEQLIKAAKENEASQKVFTDFLGKGEPDCISLIISDDNNG